MKHLHADLSTLFKPTPITPNRITLPSGPVYVRPMRIDAISSLLCYYYDVHWYEDSFTISIETLTPERALRLSRPKFSSPDKLTRYKAFVYQWMHRNKYEPRYFRTLDDAYIDAFLTHTRYQDTHPEFPRIQSTYPEYFI